MLLSAGLFAFTCFLGTVEFHAILHIIVQISLDISTREIISSF